MKLINVVKWLGKPELEAVCESEDGVRRKIKCNWMTKDRISIPNTWFETVSGEFTYQEKEAAKDA